MSAFVSVCVCEREKEREREREREGARERGLPVSPTNEEIPHADTEHRIRRSDAIGADHRAGDSATH